MGGDGALIAFQYEYEIEEIHNNGFERFLQ
jgi:hypothetical protein